MKKKQTWSWFENNLTTQENTLFYGFLYNFVIRYIEKFRFFNHYTYYQKPILFNPVLIFDSTANKWKHVVHTMR